MRTLGKAAGTGEEAGICTRYTVAGGIQASRERSAGIASGRAIVWRGLAARYEDHSARAIGAAGRVVVWCTGPAGLGVGTPDKSAMLSDGQG